MLIVLGRDALAQIPNVYGMLDPKNPLSKHPLAKECLSDDPEVRTRPVMKVLDSIMSQKPIPEFVDPAVTRSVWQEIIKAAATHYQPGKFTTQEFTVKLENERVGVIVWIFKPV